MNRRAVECDFADAMTRRSRSLILSSNAVLAFAREMITSRITGDASSSPLMISSTRREKPPTDFPNKTPKVRRRPRISFSILTRERTRTSRAASKDRSSYPERDLIVTCLNQPVHTICASPAASFRSVLLGRTFNAALACRASMQTIGRPLSCNSFHNHTAKGPVSIPTRPRSGTLLANQEAIASGQVGTFFSAMISSSASYRPEVTFIHSWHKEPLFIDAWVDRIREETGNGHGFYLFSAHSLPRSLQHEPYVSQVEETVAAVAGRLGLTCRVGFEGTSRRRRGADEGVCRPALCRGGWAPGPCTSRKATTSQRRWGEEGDSASAWAIGWQSIPPNTDEPWIGPSVEAVIDGVHRTTSRLIEIPIGFVSDHLETLYDMDIVHAGYAGTKGVAFSRIASLNTYPPFIAACKAILEKHLQGAQ